MDAVKSFFISPFYNVYKYGLFVSAVVINLPSIALRIISKGPKSLSKVTELYAFCKSIPMGRILMSGCIGMFAPYTSSIGAFVEDISEHNCTVSMHDYPWLRNPFQSLHALALANLGESASGIAMICQLEKHRNIKGIPIKISTSYYKKARGTITATGYVNLEVNGSDDMHCIIILSLLHI